MGASGDAMGAIFRGFLSSAAISVVLFTIAGFVYMGNSALPGGWWRPVLHDHKPVQRWLAVVPIMLSISILIGVNYAELADKSIGYVLVLLIATQLVGWGEEGMFRGIGVTTLRVNGLTEGKVALWSSVIATLR